jgi:chromatin remodeling complex protein RSC6
MRIGESPYENGAKIRDSPMRIADSCRTLPPVNGRGVVPLPVDRRGFRAPARVPSQKEDVLAKSKRKPNAAFMKPLHPSAKLAEIVGEKALPRTEVTKKLWAYVKRNGLQDKKNRRMINADEKLGPVFGGKKQVSMFEMTKLVSKHLS